MPSLSPSGWTTTPHFFNTLMGLVSDGQEPVVQVATWRDDWKSIRDPVRYLLLAVVKREDMGGAGLVIEAAPGYAFLTPCTQAGVLLPDAVSIIVPSTRIARLHVPRKAGIEQPIGQCATGETAPVPRPAMTLEQDAPVAPLAPLPPRRLLRMTSQRTTIRRRAWARLTSRSGRSSTSIPDADGIATLAEWMSSSPESPRGQSSGSGHASAA
jgi:hypothetical protein